MNQNIQFSPKVVQKLARKSGKSIGELAFEVSKSKGRAVGEKSIRDWMAGRVVPKADNIAALASVFGCKVDDFFIRNA